MIEEVVADKMTLPAVVAGTGTGTATGTATVTATRTAMTGGTGTAATATAAMIGAMIAATIAAMIGGTTGTAAIDAGTTGSGMMIGGATMTEGGGEMIDAGRSGVSNWSKIMCWKFTVCFCSAFILPSFFSRKTTVGVAMTIAGRSERNLARSLERSLERSHERSHERSLGRRAMTMMSPKGNVPPVKMKDARKRKSLKRTSICGSFLFYVS